MVLRLTRPQVVSIWIGRGERNSRSLNDRSARGDGKDHASLVKVTRLSFFGWVPSYFEALWIKLWPKFGNCWISRIGSLRFWWNYVQRKALMYTMCSREIFTKKSRQQQIFDSDLKGAWHYNHVTFTPVAKNFMLYCRLIYMLSILCVRLTIKVKVGIPESFKVGWYPPK